MDTYHSVPGRREVNSPTGPFTNRFENVDSPALLPDRAFGNYGLATIESDIHLPGFEELRLGRAVTISPALRSQLTPGFKLEKEFIQKEVTHYCIKVAAHVEQLLNIYIDLLKVPASNGMVGSLYIESEHRVLPRGNNHSHEDEHLRTEISIEECIRLFKRFEQSLINDGSLGVSCKMVDGDQPCEFQFDYHNILKLYLQDNFELEAKCRRVLAKYGLEERPEHLLIDRIPGHRHHSRLEYENDLCQLIQSARAWEDEESPAQI